MLSSSCFPEISRNALCKLLSDNAHFIQKPSQLTYSVLQVHNMLESWYTLHSCWSERLISSCVLPILNNINENTISSTAITVISRLKAFVRPMGNLLFSLIFTRITGATLFINYICRKETLKKQRAIGSPGSPLSERPV